MAMQDVDYELVYEPGKDEADPMDYLSRHPLPHKGRDTTEKIVKQLIGIEHAIVLDHITKETQSDKQMQNLKERIRLEDWEKQKKDKDIAPFYSIRTELSCIDEVIFRGSKIVVPQNLQRKVIKTAHSMGHLGISKIKNMIRDKYWFPEMNAMIEQIIDQCFECKVTTKQQRGEPVKMQKIPDKPWQKVQIDFGGPYPDGHYNLVVIDKRTRFPEVMTVRSTSYEETSKRLQQIFSIHGTPEIIESDRGPPFTSHRFAEFAKEQGFKHHQVTPLHPRANGDAEAFMKMVNKTEQIANLRKESREQAMQNMLIGYRSTPHPATNISPYEALYGRKMRNKLGHLPNRETVSELDQEINKNDSKYKEKLQGKADKGL